MNIDKNLIIIKGQDQTKDILSWEYRDGRIVVTYKNYTTYPFAHYNVKFFNDPEEIKAKDCYVLKNKQPLLNVARIQNFGPYIRIIYENGYFEML